MASPGPSTRKRPSRVVISDDDEDDTPEPTNPSKRSRPSTAGGGRVVSRRNGEESEDELNIDFDDTQGGDEEEGEGEERAVGEVAFRPDYQRGSDGFVAGSVVRVKLRNFMTYDFVEFKPGPYLNMIIGPNGTGKSTIAASIAIGLGFPPKVMGRANDLKAFVKQGAEEAMVEVEIKGPPKKKNPVIRRTFTNESDKSEWRLNGEPATFAAVRTVVSDFGIQANNLCCFLPQDKVAEFAKMGSVQVLEETMRAAGDPRLTFWHKKLKEKGVTVKAAELLVARLSKERDHKQTQVDRLEPDVTGFRARQGQEREIDILTILIAVAKQRLVDENHKEAKAQREALRDRRKALLHKTKPLQELLTHYGQKMEKMEIKMQVSAEKFEGFNKAMVRSRRAYEDEARKSTIIDEELNQLTRTAKRREEQKRKHRDDIRQLEATLAVPLEDVREAIREKAQEKNVSAETEKIAEDVAAAEKHMGQIHARIGALAKEEQNLSSIDVQREKDARQFDPSIGFALDWIKAHAMELEQPVIRPAMISVNITDKKRAWQVEMCTNVSQRKTFVCQTKRDYNTMLKLNGTLWSPPGRGPMKVQLHLALVEVTEARCNPHRTITPQELEAAGFDGCAIDFIDTEPAMIAYLIEYANLHKAVLTLKPGNQVNPDFILSRGVRVWVTASDHNYAMQSNYGRREYQTSTKPSTPARAFDRSVDTEAIKRVVDELGNLRREKQSLETPNADLRASHAASRQRVAQLHEHFGVIEAEIKELSAKVDAAALAEANLERIQLLLEELEAIRPADQRREELKAQKMESVKRKLRPLKAGFEACEGAIELSDEAAIASLGSLHATANHRIIGEHTRQGDAEDDELKAQVQTLSRKIEEMAIMTDKIIRESVAVLREMPEDVAREAGLRSADNQEIGTVEELTNQRADLQADLALTENFDEGLIERYDTLSAQLAELKDRVKKEGKDFARAKRTVEQILGRFNPALDSLIRVVSDKFSAAFEKVLCTGEVKVDRVGEEYDKWGIRILVSYRDGDDLQMLTGTLQSGGERALATVTYFMSLSEMARTPFSLVDEINQGMDQRAERNVHNQLVEVTCEHDAGQYFLITPKLLTGLRYHERMKVLIINNGSGLPDSADKTQRYGDLKSCLARYARAHAAAR